MTLEDRIGEEPLATVTHARVRALQGDVDGAREILQRVLARRPDDPEARRLLHSLPAAVGPGPHEGLAPAGRSARARVVKLENWLRRTGKEAKAMAESAPRAASLDDILEQVQQKVEGTQAVFLVSMDGMVAAGSSSTDMSTWEWIAASYTEIMRKTAGANREAKLDEPLELMVTTPSTNLIFRSVTREYALLAALDPASGSFGRARFELRKAAERLLPEL